MNRNNRISSAAVLASVFLIGAPAFAQGTVTPDATAPDATAPATTMPETMPGAAPDAAPVSPAPTDTLTTQGTIGGDATALGVPEGYALLTDWSAITSEQLSGATIQGPDDSSIGKISEVELTPEGTVNGVIADIGGFLGIGAHTVRLGMDQVTLYANPEGELIAQSSLTKEALTALPEYTPPS